MAENSPSPEIDIGEFDGLGLIIKWSTGVLISNECNGCGIDTRKVEGTYVPIPFRLSWYHSERLDTILFRFFQSEIGTLTHEGISEDHASSIDEFLKSAGLRGISVDRERFSDSCESWVHVTIEHFENCPFSGFDPYPTQGILVWANSD